MPRETPKYDWKCAKCGCFQAEKPAHEVDYCLRCGSDLFYQRWPGKPTREQPPGKWSVEPVRMGASVKTGKHAMKQLLYVGLVIVALAVLIALLWGGCDTVMAHAHQAAREMGGIE